MVLRPTLELLLAPDLQPTLQHQTATAGPVVPILPLPAMEELPAGPASHLHFQPTPDSQVVLQLLLQVKEVVESRHPDPGLDLLEQARLTRIAAQTMAATTLAQEVDPMLQTPLDQLAVELLALIPALMARTVLLSRAMWLEVL